MDREIVERLALHRQSSSIGAQAALEPVEVLARKPRPDLRQHVGVIAVEPDQLLGLEHLDVDQPPVDRREGQRLEAEHLLFGALDLALATTSTRFSMRMPYSPVL